MATPRRTFLAGVSASAMTTVLPRVAFGASGSPLPKSASLLPKSASLLPKSASPLPLSAVRLRPSAYATAVEVNHAYLLRLNADRLLHNFLVYAGLPPKGEIYGGWESDTIAGHTLGHYLTALVQMQQQTGDAACRERADYIVVELARVQKARGTGYVGALGRKLKGGEIVDGEPVFGEVKRGEIHSGGFDLNGSWSPLYTVHKLFAGLLDVNAAWGNPVALEVVTGLATYFAAMFDALDDAQMQTLLACEYGGLNESYAELSARTGNRRWLLIAERIYDRRVLDPLEAGQDRLANFHANTQVPKLIGLARIYELTGSEPRGDAARFFWTAVTDHHSYVIGGNADREYFSEPDSLADHITEQTCEHCNTYNMLKLTRHLFSRQPDGAWFDFYERAHLNHVMAAQNPHDAGFTYMTPLMSGADRGYSTPQDDAFWCCVGTGMESHAKHGDSIFWQGSGTLLVNLYIPAEASWAERDATVTLDTRYPFEGESTLRLNRLGRSGRFTIGLRVPKWAKGNAVVKVNGETVTPVMERGYALVQRHWKRGDSLSIALPMELRLEPTPGSPKTVAVLRGPMVLAADLGPNSQEWAGTDPVMVNSAPLEAFVAVAGEGATFTTHGLLRPADLRFVPFYSQYERRSAVYFNQYTEAAWKQEEAAFLKEQAKARDIAARSVDVMHLGEMQPERDHKLVSDNSYPVTYRGRNGRDARSGGYFEFVLAVKPGPLMLQATYWGGERGNNFDILVDNVKVAAQQLNKDHAGRFFEVEYPLPEALTRDKQTVHVRFEPHSGSTAGPVFGVRLFTATGQGSSTPVASGMGGPIDDATTA